MQPKRKPLIAGNWKMHGSISKTQTLVNALITGLKTINPLIDVAIMPTFVHLALAKSILNDKGDSAIALGAQNLYLGDEGAYTGEVAGPMLKELGCEYVLVGHSERRSIFHESNELVAAKFKAACAAGLKPVLCVGETQAEREADATESVIRDQISVVIDRVGLDAFRDAVIAYEPVWAIGTGLTATPQQAQATQAYIRQYLRQNNVDIAETIRILYGGSMKAENAHALLSMPDIDGGLIGGASLKAESFLAICAAASSVVSSKDEEHVAYQKQG